ncbi:hypothetical protein MVES_002194 [Malassezia vespertilionis]|uniref:J domain-containing protein n=1 Tax=Malassezia vespertilionis TaxID=2020962 RepID=A0A2N1JBA9_9BASI|nr:hypothetical protein MVES_002194 [Malassezia vespertilionis]
MENPTVLFFGKDDVDLYEVLGLDRNDNPTEDVIRKSYRRLALRYHPDKAALHAAGDEDFSTRFQQIGFAYSVLSDTKRKKRYDTTGSTNDSVFGGDGPVDWNEYFKTLWDGEVTSETLDKDKHKYQGSDEERQDILRSYTDYDGSLREIFAAVPYSNILDDERRFFKIVEAAIKQGDIPSTEAWEALATPKGKRLRKELKQHALSEANEAEAYAKELGVYDQLFGKKGKDKRKVTSESAKEDDLDTLRMAMRNKSTKRAAAFDQMVSDMEHRHARKGKHAKRMRN